MQAELNHTLLKTFIFLKSRALGGLALSACSLVLSGCSAPAVLSIFNVLDILSAESRTVTASDPVPLEAALVTNALPKSFTIAGVEKNTQAFLRETGTAGLVVVRNNKIIHENYSYGKTLNSRFTSMSVAKSVTSALVGIAIEEGFISHQTDLIVDYVPELAESAYATVTIEDALEMASGVDFVEEYLVLSDAFYLQLAIGESLLEETLKYKELADEPGTFNSYKSLDTQVLGWVLANATGQSVASYLQSRIWGPAGMASDARWLADDDGIEATFCCFSATTRDFAKFGLIYLNNGFYNEQQIVPEEWITSSLDTSKPHLQPGEHEFSDYDWGYGYKWWFRDEGTDYAAIGIFNQFVYVNPELNIVIAKNSASPFYLFDDLENEHFDLFRAIATHVEALLQ